MATRVRLWLARHIAPFPLMVDPYPGEDGVFIVMRQKGTTSFVRTDRFRLKSSQRLRPVVYDPTTPWAHFEPTVSCTRFVGTVAS